MRGIMGEKKTTQSPEGCLDVNSFFGGLSLLWDPVRQHFRHDPWWTVVSLLAALLGFPARGLAGFVGLPHTELPCEIIPPFPTRHHRVQSAL